MNLQLTPEQFVALYELVSEASFAVKTTKRDCLIQLREKLSGTIQESLEKVHQVQNKEKLSNLKKEWYLKNKDKVIERVKKNYEHNKEQRLVQVKEYANKNKDKIKERNMKDITCDCGAVLRKNGLKKHLETQKHADAIKKLNS